MAALELERRFNLPALAGLALKADSGREIIGYASTFENEARADSYGDIVAPGAFAEAIARHASGERRVRFLYQHSWDAPIGRVEEMKEDEKGLWTRSYTSETSQGNDVLTLVKDGALDSFSIGFYIRGYEIIERPDKTWLRKLTKIDLWEYSVVTFPANIYARIDEVKAFRAGVKNNQPTTDMRALNAAYAHALADLHLAALEHSTR